MSFPYTPNLKDEKIESLEAHSEFLNTLRLRHLHWLISAEDPENETVHEEIAGLIEDLGDQYSRLRSGLQQ